ncbi:DUF1080 domain-containing protein [Colwellia sp. 1_MG-2023]|uniref:3-keto-disaccharide hydrolase n=1 Tax=Colwellia sp. 1_MG-2023 TaxID=3062649 RepID=UPI0026E4544A|nr:DUF1080 domain-containing protein [Colwellia sp. 1_MG-2023]MDO6446965.1 DUF1080 domain-containing protein [Colwellia sp. 1_MG-2023]
MKKLIGVLTLCLTTVISGCSHSEIKESSDWQSLFDGKTLNGWKQINGSATYEVIDGAIVGTSVKNSRNSFLVTEATYSDFIMEFEAKVDSPLNSGVQFRSLSKADHMNGRVHGYQLEIDPSKRAWTGGIYDEARLGWIYPLSTNPKGRAAYQADQWNKFRIEAIGDSIRTYVNGVPTANLIDNTTAAGFFGLQVHDIGNDMSKLGKKVRWKNLRIKTTNLEQDRWDSANSIDEINYIPNMLTKRQKADGWKLLWDGKTTKGWKGAKIDTFPTKGWEINDGVLSVLSSGGGEARNGGDIITLEEFSDFELEVDFKITKGANSGIKYFVDPNLLKGKGSAIGLEFQILDDVNHKDAKKGTAGNRTIGSLYDLITAGNLTEPERDKKRFNGIGNWNRARIVVKSGDVQHWLNGVQTVEYNRHSQIFGALVAYSKYAKWPNFGRWEKGPILLQDHGDLVHFRTIKIKPTSEVKGK